MALDDYVIDVVIPPPAVGAEIAGFIPPGVWRLISIGAGLTTSATVAVRTFGWLIINPAAGTIFRNQSTVTQAASLVQVYSMACGVPNSPALILGNSVIVELPVGVILIGGDILGSQTINLQVGDQYGPTTIRLGRAWRP